MRTSFSKASLKLSPENRPSASIVNYVWINLDKFEVGYLDNSPLCGIPLHYVDRAIENARNYPQAEFNIWIDPRYVGNTPTLFLLQSHLFFSDVPNMRIRNLTDIESYLDNEFFSPDAETAMWHRADIARLMAVRQTLSEQPEKISVYADFDVKDVKVESRKFWKALDDHGMIIGTPIPIKHHSVENGYFAFDARRKSTGILSHIIDKSFKQIERSNPASFRNDVYMVYRGIVESQRSNLKEILIQTLKPCNYSIRKNPDYLGISIT